VLRHYALTMSGVAQQLSTVLAADSDDHPGLEVHLEGAFANVNPIYVGGDSSVSSSSYSSRIPGPAAAAPTEVVPDRIFQGVKLRLKDFWVIGTASEVLHIGVISS
jgi:hypothetical protein